MLLASLLGRSNNAAMSYSLMLEKVSSALGPLILIGLAVLAFFSPDDIRELLIYDRGRIQSGEFWRLLTGHFLHTNLNHLLLNCAAVAVLWVLHSDYYRALGYLLLVVLLALLTGVGLLFFSPSVSWYVGLSGVLHGLIIWGGIHDIQRGWMTGYLIVLGTAGKVAWEQFGGDTSAAAALIGAPVAIDAHLWGAVAGALVPGLWLVFGGGWRRSVRQY